MSISDRLDDASILFHNGRKQGALLSVLVAVAATSRRRYPKDDFRDNNAFVRFVVDEYPAIIPSCNWQPVSDEDYERNLRPTASEHDKKGYWFRVPKSKDRDTWPDDMMPLPAILYSYVRCNLAHEAALPDNVEFVDADPGQLIFSTEENRIVLSNVAVFPRRGLRSPGKAAR